MKPVLAHVTLDHEAGHIVRQPAKAIHRHCGHLRLALERSVESQVRSAHRSGRQQLSSFLDYGWAQKKERKKEKKHFFYKVNPVRQGTNPQFTNGELPQPGCNTRGVAVGGNLRKSTGLQNSFNK